MGAREGSIVFWMEKVHLYLQSAAYLIAWKDGGAPASYATKT